MKYPTLRKVMLTTMALVASLALSAQAGRPTLSAAKQQQGKRTAAKHFPFTAQKAGGGQHSPLDFIYQLDDGTAEDAIGLTAGGDIISLNEFAVVPGSETILSVEIAWVTPAFFDPSLDGLPYTVAIWSEKISSTTRRSHRRPRRARSLLEKLASERLLPVVL